MGVYLEFMWVGAQFSNKFQEELGRKSEDYRSLELSSTEYESLIWRKKHEFTFKGNLFDVIREKQTENGYVLIVKHDGKEQNWLSNWLSYFDQGDEDDLESNGALLPFLKHTMKLDSFEWQINRTFPLVSDKIPAYLAHENIVFLESGTPPPEA